MTLAVHGASVQSVHAPLVWLCKYASADPKERLASLNYILKRLKRSSQLNYPRLVADSAPRATRSPIIANNYGITRALAVRNSSRESDACSRLDSFEFLKGKKLHWVRKYHTYFCIEIKKLIKRERKSS